MRKLNLKPYASSGGLADFDKTYLRFQTGTNTEFTGDLIFKWQMYLDQDGGFLNRGFSFLGNSTDGLSMFLWDSSIYFQSLISSVYYQRVYSIKNFQNQILNCEIRKIPWPATTYVEYFKINDVSLAGVDVTFPGGATGFAACDIGSCKYYIMDDVSNGATLDMLDNATIWNISITEVSTGLIKHLWKGYPNGNTLSAWEDQIGTLDITTENIAGTRNVPGFNSGDLKNSNKLSFKPGTSIYGGLDGSIINSAGTRNITGGPSEVANFNKDTSIHVLCASTLSATELLNEINFKLYMDVSFYTNLSPILYNCRGAGSNQTKFTIYLQDNYLIVDGGSGATQIRGIDISALSNQIVDIKIKTIGGGTGRDIVYIQVNDVSQNTVDKSAQSIGLFDFFKIGLFGNPSSPQFQYPLFNATVWDLDIKGVHHWKGYPAGNTNNAWKDIVTTNRNSNKLMMNKRSSDIYELLNFTNTTVDLITPAYVNISQKRKINFWLYLDSSNFALFSKEAMFNFQNQSNSNDGLKIYGEGSNLHMHTGNLAGSKKYSIENFARQKLYCEVVKIDSSIVSLSINGSTQTSLGQSSASSVDAMSALGYGGQYFTSGAIWDIEIIDNSTGTMMHQWKGYPAGNTNAAWVDLVGSINGNLSGPGPYTTRSI